MHENNLRFEVGENVSLTDGEWSIISYKGRDFWRAFLDTGENRELAVYSHLQTPVKIEKNVDSTTFYYDKLVAEDGQSFHICLALTICSEKGGLVFTSKIENRSEVILNELQYPFYLS